MGFMTTRVLHRPVAAASLLASISLGASVELRARPTVTLPSVEPAAVSEGVPTPVRVGALIHSDDAELIPGSVVAFELDATGRGIRVLGRLVDDGGIGDEIAGDGIFGGELMLRRDEPGIFRLAVSAAFRGCSAGCARRSRRSRFFLPDYRSRSLRRIWTRRLPIP